MVTYGVSTLTTATSNIRFVKITAGGLRNKKPFVDLLKDLSLGRTFPLNFPEFQIDKDFYQVRELMQSGGFWHGCFGKLRKDAPHIVNAATGVESSIKLGQDDKVLEKSYFLYSETENVILWQVNSNAGGLSSFKEYLKRVSTLYVKVEHVIDQAQLSSLLTGDVKEVVFHIASLPALSGKQLGWNSDAMRFLQNSGAASTKFQIKAPSAGKLRDRIIKPFVRELAKIGGTKTKLKIAVDDMVNPVDIFINTLKDSISYTKKGHYPDPVSIIAQMKTCYQRNKAKI